MVKQWCSSREVAAAAGAHTKQLGPEGDTQTEPGGKALGTRADCRLHRGEADPEAAEVTFCLVGVEAQEEVGARGEDLLWEGVPTPALQQDVTGVCACREMLEV